MAPAVAVEVVSPTRFVSTGPDRVPSPSPIFMHPLPSRSGDPLPEYSRSGAFEAFLEYLIAKLDNSIWRVSHGNAPIDTLCAKRTFARFPVQGLGAALRP